ncbi:MAG: stage III sporulation protein SpoIIIAB [Tuberibacillus sp.]
MKWIGALFIIISATAIGRLLALQFRERPRQLRQLKSALQSLETEITYGLAPIGEAARRLSEQLPEPSKSFFYHFSIKLAQGSASLREAWDETLHEFWPRTAMKKNELEIMKQFGATLGLSDRENQQKQIRLALSHLEREEAEARAAQNQYEKMVKSLGFLAGLLLVLLLF